MAAIYKYNLQGANYSKNFNQMWQEAECIYHYIMHIKTKKTGLIKSKKATHILVMVKAEGKVAHV